MLNIKKILTKIVSDMSSTKFSATRGSALSGGMCFGTYDRAARSVRLSFFFTASSTVSTSTVLFTIPSQYAPSVYQEGVMIYYANNGSNGGYTCKINPDGKIYQNAGSIITAGYGYIEYSF